MVSLAGWVLGVIGTLVVLAILWFGLAFLQFRRYRSGVEKEEFLDDVRAGPLTSFRIQGDQAMGALRSKGARPGMSFGDLAALDGEQFERLMEALVYVGEVTVSRQLLGLVSDDGKRRLLQAQEAADARATRRRRLYG